MPEAPLRTAHSCAKELKERHQCLVCRSFPATDATEKSALQQAAKEAISVPCVSVRSDCREKVDEKGYP